MNAWTEPLTEEVLDPDQAIVDAHHHLWGRPREPYGVTELRGDVEAGHRVVGTVFVECHEAYDAGAGALRAPVGETRWIAEVARHADRLHPDGPRLCAGIVGHVDLRAGKRVGPVLDEHIAAADGRFRGVRDMAASSPDRRLWPSVGEPPPAGMLADPAFRAGYGQLGARGLSFDAWVFFTQLDDVVDLARAVPDTTIVLDHAGGPVGIAEWAGRDAEVTRLWRTGIERVAACPNVVVKLGGLAMRVSGLGFDTRPVPPSSVVLAQALRPWVEYSLELFGAERAMFESNFPVERFSTGYVVLWNAFKRLVVGCSPAERDALFRGTAQRVYRLDLPW